MILNYEGLNSFESKDVVLSDELEIIWNAAVVGF